MSDEILNVMHAKIDDISKDIKEMSKDVGELKITAIKHDINLEMHMKASETLKALYDHLKDNEIQPIQKDLNQIKGAYKLLGALGLIIGIIAALVKIFSK